MLKDFKEPDLTLKRKTTRNITYNVISKEFREELIDLNPAFEQYKLSDLEKIVIDFNFNTLNGTMISNRNGITLPCNLGTIFYGTYADREGALVDKATSLKIGKSVKHRNFESDGYKGWVYYITQNVKHAFGNGKMWKFHPNKKTVTKMYAAYKKNWKFYIPVSNANFVSSTFHFKKKNSLTLENYNEFNFD